MSNRTYACFTCLVARRKPEPLVGSVDCPACGLTMENIGYRLRVPPRTNKRAWAALQALVRTEAQNQLDGAQRARSDLKATLRAEINKMKARPKSAGRESAIAELENELKRLMS